MKKMFKVIAGIALALTGCSSQNIEGYSEIKPALDIRNFLNGELEAGGILFNYSGEQDDHFFVTMKGSWNGNEGTLEENFSFGSGKKDQRVWKIKFTDDHNFTATAHDVVGEAIGQQFGNAVNMKYTLRVPRGDSSIDLSMDDWMYLVDGKNIINRTKMRKLGIQVGELTLYIRKK